MSFQHSIQRILSGEARGVGPSALRGLLRAVEPFYAAAVTWRNRGFDHHPLKINRLPRPVISVGNITTGGTGKTPLVRWLAGELLRRGLGTAVVSRGYKAAPGTLGDEQRMLLALMGHTDPAAPAGPPLVVGADPDRFAIATRLIETTHDVEAVLLDDGFQHRRLHRDVDIVLLHAAEPFGFGHVLPRGLLREPLSALARADAIILTNSTSVDDAQLVATANLIRRWNARCLIVHESHRPTGFRTPVVASSQTVDVPIGGLATQAAFCFSGLGSPSGFESQVRAVAGRLAGKRRFPDHHNYNLGDLQSLRAEAARSGADILVTTEKDWVKIARLDGAQSEDPPIWRMDVEAQFSGDGSEQLMCLVEAAIRRARPHSQAVTK